MKRHLVAIGAAVALTGCLASKGDVALLQNQLSSMQTAASQAQAENRAHIDQVLSQLGRTNDSIRMISQRVARVQGDLQNFSYEINRQILQIQELSGQSQKRIQELRAAMEERNQAAAAQPTAIVADSVRLTPSVPGEAQLFQNSVDQLRRGSNGVARGGFEELVRSYPNSESVPDAMIYIATTYANERNQGAADSVYTLVIQRFPKSPRAATALYKHGLALRNAGQTAAARAAFQRVVKEYPNSDEAELANGVLRGMR